MVKLGEHPHIVRVLDSGEDGGVPFIVSEYVGGGDLQGVLDDCAGRQLEVEQAIDDRRSTCAGRSSTRTRGGSSTATSSRRTSGSATTAPPGSATSASPTDRPARGCGRGDARRHGRLPAARAGAGARARRALGPLLARRDALRAAHGRAAVPGRGRGRDHRPAPEHATPVAPSRHRPEVPAGPRPGWSSICSPSRPTTGRRAPPRPGGRSSRGGRGRRPGRAAARTPRTRSRRWRGGVFVGREPSSRRCAALLEDALAGQGAAAAAVRATPGSARRAPPSSSPTYARVRGARVYWGRCHEGERPPPYWPWAEAMRGYVLDARPGRAALAARQPAPPTSRRSSPSSPSGSATSRSRPTWTPSRRRFRLFDCVRRLPRRRRPARRPLVLVLDDLHWADEPSLLLLRFLARRLADAGLLVIGTYRDVELGRHHPLAGRSASSAGVDGSRRIALHGLDAGRDRRLHRDDRRRRSPAARPRGRDPRPDRAATRSSSARSCA